MFNSKLIIAVLFVAVLLLVFGAVDFLRPTQTIIQAAPVEAPPEQQFTVWQLEQEAYRGDYTKELPLKRVVLKASEAHAHGINSDVLPELLNTTILRHDKPASSYLYPHDVVQVGDEDYIDFLITPGKAVYPLTISSANLIDGFIRPGDHIDVLAVSSPNDNLASNQNVKKFNGVKAQMLLEKIKVLSVGDHKTNKKTASSETNRLSARQDQTSDSRVTIVVEVEPKWIPKVTLAQRTMHLEVYKSQAATMASSTYVSDVIDNYTGVIEMRGSQGGARGEVY